MKLATKFKKFFSGVIILSLVFQGLGTTVLPAMAATGTAGPNNPTSVIGNSGGGDYNWSNPSGAKISDDASWASANLESGGNTTRYLKATGYNLSIPANATVNGIELRIEKHQVCTDNDGCSSSVRDSSVRLVKNGSTTGDNFASATSWTSSDSTTLYGSGSNLWGTTWTAADINNTNFGAVISANRTNGGDRAASVDNMSIKVYYSLPNTITASVVGAGGVITPAGDSTVNNGANKTYTITPNSGYIVSDVLVDGVSHGRINSYTFTNVMTDHTISATFNSGWNAPSNSPSDHNVSSPSNAYTSNNGYTVFNDQNDRVDYSNFGLSLPAGVTITGIEVAAEANRPDPRTINISLSSDSGDHYTTTKNVGAYTNTDSTIVIGSNSDSWGRSWTSADFNNSNFRMRVHAVTSGPGDILNLDQIQIKVYFVDDIAPVLSLNTPNPDSVLVGNAYTDPGATASDTHDGNITGSIVVSGTVDTANVGTYYLYYDVTDAAGNPAEQLVRTVNVTPRQVTITANAQTKSYGATDPDFTDAYTVTGDELIEGDEVTGELERVAGENVDTYLIKQGTLEINSNYEITYNGANLTITKAKITATAGNKTKVSGSVDPTLTYTVTSGQLFGTDLFSGVLARAPGEASGLYGINQGTLSLGDNYDLIFIPGVFEITPAPIPAETVSTDASAVLGTQTTDDKDVKGAATTKTADEEDKDDGNWWNSTTFGVHNWLWSLLGLSGAGGAGWWFLAGRRRRDEEQ
ncbi:DUF5011 domain-containing protein [Candidatus Saccharibacteria bacterium]|nr:DUF5011 domain-containing protein [Candidatus Saccharibacteria bacterium]